jgi:hypothetical protein
MSTLESLITEANDAGWSVNLRQHPDRRAHWECQLSRRVEQTATGIVREIGNGFSSHSPHTALLNAMDDAEHNATRLEPAGAAGSKPNRNSHTPNLLDLLGLAKPTVPMITRRF